MRARLATAGFFSKQGGTGWCLWGEFNLVNMYENRYKIAEKTTAVIDLMTLNTSVLEKKKLFKRRSTRFVLVEVARILVHSGKIITILLGEFY